MHTTRTYTIKKTPRPPSSLTPLPPLTQTHPTHDSTIHTQATRLQAARRCVREHLARLPGRYALNVEGPEVVAIDMRLMAEARAAASSEK